MPTAYTNLKGSLVLNAVHKIRNILAVSVSLTVATTLVSTTPVVAHNLQCADYEMMTETLREQYGDTVAGRGVTNAGEMLELLLGREAGSWSLIVVNPGGLTCLIAGGNGWRDVEQIPAGPRV